MVALQVLLEKCIQLFLLIWGHRVDLCTEGLHTRGKLNSMVPSLLRGELIKGLFREDIPELLIRFRNRSLKYLIGANSAVCSASC